MRRYFEVLDTEPEKGAKDWANTFADDGKFVNGTRILEGSKGVWGAISHHPDLALPLISRKQSFRTRTIPVLDRMAELVPCRQACLRAAGLRGFGLHRDRELGDQASRRLNPRA
jgi:hypothetical protein